MVTKRIELRKNLKHYKVEKNTKKHRVIVLTYLCLASFIPICSTVITGSGLLFFILWCY